MFNLAQLDALKAPLNRSSVKTRQQAGRAMSYIEGWHAIAEANRIFGFDGWDRETVELRQLGEPREVEGKWRVAYYARLRINVRALQDGHAVVIVREGCGYGSGIDRDVGSAHESALKEAETDAMKRALMTFGNPFGLALYDKEQSEVVDDTKAAPAAKPAPAAASGKTTHREAMAFGDAALAFLKKVSTGPAFDAWHRENRDKIAAVKEHDAVLHKEIIKGVEWCQTNLKVPG